MTTSTTLGPLVASGDDLVAVTIWVKASEAQAFQIQAHELHRAMNAFSATPGTYTPPFPSTHGPTNAWELPAWQLADAAAAIWILGDLGKNQRRIIAHLVAAGPEGVWTGELRRSSNYDDSTGIGGVMKAITGRFRRTDRRPLWSGGEKDSQKGQRLPVKDETARSVFAQALKDNYRDLAANFDID